jgi:hypothetical protein
MKRYFCTVAAGIALALVSTATASADIGLPLPGQSGSQEAFLGDQTVGEQKNTADVEQKQGNGNINISPAIGILGGAETTNAQGNGNYAESEIDQENEVEQSQDSTQKQDATQNGCCDGQSQTGEQKTSFGDQTVGEQKNEATVSQEQGNGNINISPAIAVFGNAETTNYQGNGNVAKSEIDQENEVEQSQDSYQDQSLEQSGSSGHCCGGQSQTGEQRTYGGDQTVGEQKNTADVEQKQGNGNINISPAIAVFGNAETTNHQGNGNVAKSEIDQENEVEQSQDATQKQELSQKGGDCCSPKHGYGGKACCDNGQSQTGEQKTSFGDQTVGEQKNEATVTQKQGNDNLNISPAIAIGGGQNGSCYSKCETSHLPLGGGAETTNAQGNGNYAESEIDQENEVEQSQDSTQKQDLTQLGGRCCEPRPSCKSSYGCEPKKDYGRKPSPECSSSCEPRKEYGKKSCCEHGPSQTGEQKVFFGDQTVGEQKNRAEVTQKQGNDNVSFAPAVGFGGRDASCRTACGKSRYAGHDGAVTKNKQGNGNVAKSEIDQENEVEQKQRSYQEQDLVEMCKGLIHR